MQNSLILKMNTRVENNKEKFEGVAHTSYVHVVISSDEAWLALALKLAIFTNSRDSVRSWSYTQRPGVDGWLYYQFDSKWRPGDAHYRAKNTT